MAVDRELFYYCLGATLSSGSFYWLGDKGKFSKQIKQPGGQALTYDISRVRAGDTEVARVIKTS